MQNEVETETGEAKLNWRSKPSFSSPQSTLFWWWVVVDGATTSPQYHQSQVLRIVNIIDVQYYLRQSKHTLPAVSGDVCPLLSNG